MSIMTSVGVREDEPESACVMKTMRKSMRIFASMHDDEEMEWDESGI